MFTMFTFVVPNAMVDAVKGSLEENQIKYSNFYTEKFVPTGTVFA